jgi:hypothetical protein
MRLYHRIKNALIYDVNSLKARYQRFKRGYSYGDVWDMDRWFIRTVKPMLTHLRDHGIGIPNDLYVEGSDNERIYWENTLTEMITCLDLMDEDNAEKFLGIAENDYSRESCKKVSNLIEENKNRFFELFSKYFFSLWD